MVTNFIKEIKTNNNFLYLYSSFFDTNQTWSLQTPWTSSNGWTSYSPTQPTQQNTFGKLNQIYNATSADPDPKLSNSQLSVQNSNNRTVYLQFLLLTYQNPFTNKTLYTDTEKNGSGFNSGLGPSTCCCVYSSKEKISLNNIYNNLMSALRTYNYYRDTIFSNDHFKNNSNFSIVEYFNSLQSLKTFLEEKYPNNIKM